MVKHWHARVEALSKDKYVIILREGEWMKIRIGEKKGVSSSEAEIWRQSWTGIRIEGWMEDLVGTSLIVSESQRGEGVGISRRARVEYLVAKNNIGLAPWGHRSVVVRTNRKWRIAIARIRSRKAQRFFFRFNLGFRRKKRKVEREREYSRLSESTLEEIFGAFDEREIGVME